MNPNPFSRVSEQANYIFSIGIIVENSHYSSMFSSHSRLWSAVMATRDKYFLRNTEFFLLGRYFIIYLKFCWNIITTFNFTVYCYFGGSSQKSEFWCSHISHVTSHNLWVMDVMNFMPDFWDPLHRKWELLTNYKHSCIFPKINVPIPGLSIILFNQVFTGGLFICQGKNRQRFTRI